MLKHIKLGDQDGAASNGEAGRLFYRIREDKPTAAR